MSLQYCCKQSNNPRAHSFPFGNEELEKSSLKQKATIFDQGFLQKCLLQLNPYT